MRRRHLLLALGAGVSALAATGSGRRVVDAGAPLSTPAAARIRQELGAERCRQLLAASSGAGSGANPGADLARRVEADLRAGRILFVDSQPFTPSELAAALARPGARSLSGP